MTYVWIVLGLLLSALIGVVWAALILGEITDAETLERYERERAAFEAMFE